MIKDNIYTLMISYLDLCIFCVILLSKRSLAAHYQYEACVPTTCGNGPNISYPFHLLGQQESYCGYPGFVLTCSKDGFPLVHLPENEYVVDHIFYQNQSLHVYDSAVLASEATTCLPRIRNTTLPPDQLDYVNITGLHLFSNCTKPLPDELLRYNVNCGYSSEDGNSSWELALYDKDENVKTAIENCEENIVAPVEGNGDERDNEMVNVAEVLAKGFLLNWTAMDCSKCADSGGHCGFNATSYHFRCFCPDRPHSVSCKPGKGNTLFRKIFLIGGVTMVSLTSTSIILFLFIRRRYRLLKLLRFQEAQLVNGIDIELFLKNNGNLAPRRYKYLDIKKMTDSFTQSLGKGGYGSVYKGKLSDGRLVAVKMLNESKGNGEEFMNEVASISRTSHVNVVTLLGFCFEGSKRALIYDFMPNGSLEKFIQNSATSSAAQVGLGWEKLFEIAIGIARGLEYLHQGCNTRILHFDIKPHNILLDKDLNPKISDFGLAKLCPNRSSIVSMLVARGTIGYIAPEVFCRNFGVISHKSDVYSYGMMILEIAGTRKNEGVDHSSEIYFPQYIYQQLEMEGENLDGIRNGDESQFTKRKLITVGLWCIQMDPKDRPSMKRVVEMLEGELELLHVPPKPYLSSPQRWTPKFSTSESTEC